MPSPLEPEQNELLIRLVEATRSVPPNERQRFTVVHELGELQHTVMHSGLPRRFHAYEHHLEMLAQYGLRALSRSARGAEFDVAPDGFALYEELKNAEGSALERLETPIRRFLDSDQFTTLYAVPFSRWRRAEEMLWAGNLEGYLTDIGHALRETMQAFAVVCVERYPPEEDAGDDPSRTIVRIRAVLDRRAGEIGATERPFLDAFLAYWGTVSDLVQRQEHGGQRGGAALTWEDARRAVFHTMIVMYEIARALERR